MSARRNKKYTPREIRQPMMRATHDALALELRLGAEALILAPSIDTYNQLMLMMSSLTTAGLTSASLNLALRTLTAICDRFEQVKAVNVSPAEAEELRSAVAALDAELPKITANRFRAAVALTDQTFNRLERARDLEFQC